MDLFHRSEYYHRMLRIYWIKTQLAISSVILQVCHRKRRKRGAFLLELSSEDGFDFSGFGKH
jgi:hypothetical protein